MERLTDKEWEELIRTEQEEDKIDSEVEDIMAKKFPVKDRLNLAKDLFSK